MDIDKLRRTMGGGAVSDSGRTRINHPTKDGRVWVEILGKDGFGMEVELRPMWDFEDLFDPDLPTARGTRYTHSTEGEIVAFGFGAGEFREFPG